MTAAAGWRPEREVEIIAGTATGGGLDRTARAFIAALEAEHLLDVPMRLVNMPGDGGRKPWPHLDTRAGDPHVLSISSPNLTTDRLTGLTAFDHDDYTPLAILCNEYIAFAARTDSPLKNGADLLQALRVNAQRLRIALSTSLGNPNHIALAQVAQHAGGASPSGCSIPRSMPSPTSWPVTLTSPWSPRPARSRKWQRGTCACLPCPRQRGWRARMQAWRRGKNRTCPASRAPGAACPDHAA